MSSKTFFKPNKWKIILTLVFLFLSQFIPIIPCYTGLTTGELSGREVGVWKLCALGGPFNLFISLGHYYDYFGLQNGELLSLIYVLIISYLISCALLSLRNKN